MLNKGLITKGSGIYFAHYNAGAVGAFTEITNCTKLPSLGGDVEKIEVTTLKDSAHQYIPGLIEFGDMEAEFLYDAEEATSNYRVVADLGREMVRVKIELGDIPTQGGTSGSVFEFDAILTPALQEVVPNEALKFTVRMALQSDIEMTAFPA